MNLGVWTFRTSVAGSPARRLLACWGGRRLPLSPPVTAILLAIFLFVLNLPLLAQSPEPVEEHGRVVWTNDNPELPGAASPGRGAPKEYVYWSNSEQRWKPVRLASPRALRSARKVAGEVSSYIQSHPALAASDAADANASQPAKGGLASYPNYASAAGGRLVTSAQIDRYITEAAARHHVDPNLVRALIKVESNFNPRAISSKGAMGLMQLMPATARRYDVSNPLDPAQNVDAGVRHLKGLLDDFRGDVPLTLAAYNAGEGAVQRNGGIPPYTETRNYVRRITGILSGTDFAGGVLAGAAAPGASAAPIEIHRDERGRLVISNTD